jgi:hypothetical protein
VYDTFRRLQWVSAGLYLQGHGCNDTQKTNDVAWLLIASGPANASAKMPLSWVI